MCLIASLLVFPSPPARLPASVPHPRSLTHREGERDTHTHTHTRTHAGYMNGRREPILPEAGRAAALGRWEPGLTAARGGRHAGDARASSRDPSPASPSARSLCSLPSPPLSPSLLSLRFYLRLFAISSSFSNSPVLSSLSFSVSSSLTPSLLAFSPPFSNFLRPYPRLFLTSSACVFCSLSSRFGFRPRLSAALSGLLSLPPSPVSGSLWGRVNPPPPPADSWFVISKPPTLFQGRSLSPLLLQRSQR